MIKAYYFGCVKEVGHYWWTLGLRKIYNDKLPGVDAVYCPPDSEQEGRAQIIYLTPNQYGGAYTLISFWDYSVDSRPGSNSNFMLEGVLSFEDMKIRSKELFPEIWKRFEFEVQQWRL